MAFKRKVGERENGKTLTTRKPFQRRRIVPIPLGLPAEKWARMRYVQEITIDPGIASIAAHYFRANSLFDPDFTGTGHQPLNFDQLIAGYQHYTVHGSKLTATVMQLGTTTLLPAVFGIFSDANSTLSFTQPSQVIEANERQSQWRQTGGVQSGPFGEPKVHLGYSARRFFGIQGKTLPHNQRALFNGNPDEEAFFCVWAGNVSGNNPGQLVIMVEIEYLALLTERSFVAQS